MAVKPIPPKLMTRRSILLGGLGTVILIAGSVWHQSILTGRFQRRWASLPKGHDRLPPIPVFDAREVGPVGHARSHRSQMVALQDACCGPQTPAVSVLTRVSDTLARRWLSRCRSPYITELEDIAALAERPGLYLLNSSYEWGCTSLAAASQSGTSARLLRTVDWSFNGLGRYVELVRQKGPAGEFVNVTWPGAVGVLTAMASGRFAAAINYAPDRMVIESKALRPLNGLINTADTYFNISDPPAAHVLRQVFETARNFQEARVLLEQTPIAKAAIFTLVGLAPSETCVIERDRRAFRTMSGIASAANAWRYGSFPGTWQSVGGDEEDPRGDNDDRCAFIETFAGKATGDFDWVRDPILNEDTRLAVEADPGTARIRIRGYEAGGDGEMAEPVTQTLDYRV